jgi:hypothetical protein
MSDERETPAPLPKRPMGKRRSGADPAEPPLSIVLISANEVEHALDLYRAEPSSAIVKTVETSPDEGMDADRSWPADAPLVKVPGEEEVFTPAHGPSFLTIARQLAMVALTVLTLVCLAWMVPPWMPGVPRSDGSSVDPVADRVTREAPPAPPVTQASPKDSAAAGRNAAPILPPNPTSTTVERRGRSRVASDTAPQTAKPAAAGSQPQERPAAPTSPAGSTTVRQLPKQFAPSPSVASAPSGPGRSSPAAMPDKPPPMSRTVPDILAQPSPLPVLGAGPPPVVRGPELALAEERATATSGPNAPAAAIVAPASNVSGAGAPDTSAIHAVLGRYRIAFTDLDSARVADVWPSVDKRALDRAFSQLAQQEFSFDSCQIAVSGVLATARCTGQARHVPKVGPRTAKLERRQWNFTLRKSQGDWIIDSISSR